MEQEQFGKQVSGESSNPQNRRAEGFAKWVGLSVGGLLVVGVWLGGERDGLKLATELGVCAFFGFLASWVTWANSVADARTKPSPGLRIEET